MSISLILENIVFKSTWLIEKGRSCSVVKYNDLVNLEQYLSPEKSFSKQLVELNEEIAKYIQTDKSLHWIDSLALKKVLIPELEILGMKVDELIPRLEVVNQCASELFERQMPISSRRSPSLLVTSSSSCQGPRFAPPLESKQGTFEPIQEEQTLDGKILDAIKTNEMSFISEVAALSVNALKNIDSSVFDRMFQYLAREGKKDLLKRLVHLRNGQRRKLSDDCFFEVLKRSFFENRDIYTFLIEESLNEGIRSVKWRLLLQGFVKIGFNEGLVDILSYENYLASLSKIPAAQAIHKAFYEALRLEKHGLREILSKAALDLGFPINQGSLVGNDSENGPTTVNASLPLTSPPNSSEIDFALDRELGEEHARFLGYTSVTSGAPSTFEPFPL